MDEKTAAAAYLAISTVVAVSAFLVAEWSRHAGTPAPNYGGRLALVVGFLWPVITIGMAQLLSLMMVRRIFLHKAANPESFDGLSRVDLVGAGRIRDVGEQRLLDQVRMAVVAGTVEEDLHAHLRA